MLIALEGCDGTGKTTLARLLAEVYDAEIIHCSTHTSNTVTFFRELINLSRERNIIADRWCYGQFVYQNPEDRPMGSLEEDSYDNLAKLEEYMLMNEVKVILVDAPAKVIKQRLAARGETPINGLTVEGIQERFRYLKNRSLLTWSEYMTGGISDV